jgi:hypothetical protein
MLALYLTFSNFAKRHSSLAACIETRRWEMSDIVAPVDVCTRNSQGARAVRDEGELTVR